MRKEKKICEAFGKAGFKIWNVGNRSQLLYLTPGKENEMEKTKNKLTPTLTAEDMVDSQLWSIDRFDRKHENHLQCDKKFQGRSREGLWEARGGVSPSAPAALKIPSSIVYNFWLSSTVTRDFIAFALRLIFMYFKRQIRSRTHIIMESRNSYLEDKYMIRFWTIEKSEHGTQSVITSVHLKIIFEWQWSTVEIQKVWFVFFEQFLPFGLLGYYADRPECFFLPWRIFVFCVELSRFCRKSVLKPWSHPSWDGKGISLDCRKSPRFWLLIYFLPFTRWEFELSENIGRHVCTGLDIGK